MKIHSNFCSLDGRSFRFRRKHACESFSGQSGVLALTTIIDFEVKALHFAAANDLCCADEPMLRLNPVYLLMAKTAKLGVAIYLMPRSTYEEQELVAKGLNDALIAEAKAA